MDNIILQELKCTVEQAVRPLRATLARKRRMREELLAHLTAIFEEEVAKLGDEQAALAQAKLRFGDPRELTGQIQETEPWWDWFARVCDTLGQRWPHESLGHFTRRTALWALAQSAVAVIVLLPYVYYCGRQNELALRAYVLFCVATMNIPLTLGVILSTEGMYRALYRDPHNRSRRLVISYGLASLTFFPVLAFTWCWALSGNFAVSFAHLRFALFFAPLAPFLFVLLARQAAESWRHGEEWAGLEIDG